MTVRPRVPRARSARMRFSGMPQRPKPPIMMLAPSGTSATAAAASASTLFTTADYSAGSFLQGGAPPARLGEELDQATAVHEIRAQLLQHGDQRVERRPDLVGIGRGDVAPDIRGAR